MPAATPKGDPAYPMGRNVEMLNRLGAGRQDAGGEERREAANRRGSTERGDRRQEAGGGGRQRAVGKRGSKLARQQEKMKTDA